MPSDVMAIDELVERVMERIRAGRGAIGSTYRVQFHKGFTFSDAKAIVPYLAELGVTHLYASPYLKAQAGSLHGYDVVDHCRLNPELGNAEDFDRLVGELKKHGMSQIADIVPNHVGIANNDNVWWNDVLESGVDSVYADYFDINWNGVWDLRGRVLVPILGGMYGEELEKGNLKLGFERGGFFVSYYERRFPVSVGSYQLILGDDLGALKGDDAAAYRGIVEECEKLSRESRVDSEGWKTPTLALPRRTRGGEKREGAITREGRHRIKEEIKRRLGELVSRSEAVAKFIRERVETFNGVVGEAASFDRLDGLLRGQCFRLACWRVGPDAINYRRFFDVNDLAALAMEREEVFEATHGLILKLLGEGKIGGVRVDHPDGLYDPEEYFRRLQSQYVLAVAVARAVGGGEWDEGKTEAIRARLEKSEDPHPSPPPEYQGRGNRIGVLARPLYVLGEKILAVGEPLVKSWAIDGTSGYDFLNVVNGVFVDTSAAGRFDEIYSSWTGEALGFEEIGYRKKKMILDVSLASELNMLSILLKGIAERSRKGVDFSLRGLREALGEVIACFPVYRTYISERGVSEMDRFYVWRAIGEALDRNPGIERRVFEFIEEVLIGEGAGEDVAERRRFAGKFQQVTSPVMAKGIEDTAFYNYNRLLSLNEVGGNPGRFGVEAGDLHAYFAERQREWPGSMNTLSTHDTKRSEDVRARLNVLSEMPERWQDCLGRWGELNARHRGAVDGVVVPDRNEEYAIYQTLLGAWPLDLAEMEGFKKRVRAYMVKFLREAKAHTGWANPNKAYEGAVDRFIEAILDEGRAGEFLGEFGEVQRRVSHLGMINSLAQTVIKLTAPGIPDTYQGCELWDFSLVDPDNRRAVDFERRVRLMREVSGRSVRELLESAESGGIKLKIQKVALKVRQSHHEVFMGGEYVALRTAGVKARHVFAFARVHEGRVVVVAVPRLCAGLVGEGEWPCGGKVWGDTTIALPEGMRGCRFQNVFTNIPMKTIGAREVFADCPVAIFISE